MSDVDNIFDNSSYSLSEKQSESVFYLNSSEFRPFPKKPRVHTESDTFPQAENDTVEIQLASQFYAWLGSLNATETSENYHCEVELLETLSNQEQYCLAITDMVDEIISKLLELKEKYDSVSQKTNNLHETCESLLQTQTELSQKADDIDSIIQTFNNLASVEAKLNAHNAVLSAERMRPIFDMIDSSIAFLEKHIFFKDSPMYLSRFKVCLGTALDQVKGGVKNTIKRMVMELAELGDAINSDNSFILLYGRFRSQGPRVRSLMSLMELRIDRVSDYKIAIAECEEFYLTKREALVQPVAGASIAELTSKYSSNHCELVRTTVSFMLHMCEDEVSLYHQFFLPEPSAALEYMLANLCRCAYDSLRPYLIHVNHIEILTEICSLLRHEFIEEQNTAGRPELSAFVDMCRSLLADVQQRLIFRAHIYIRSQIQDYSPSPGDLAYPEKLEMIEEIAQSLVTSSQAFTSNKGDPLEETVPVTTNPNEAAARKTSVTSTTSSATQSHSDFHGMWYPTVRRALVCISNLNRCLDVDSFQGLAQICSTACINSLIKAKQHLEAHKQRSSDGRLFFIKHLLILREQMTPFNVDFRVKETSLDFSDLKSAAYMALPKMGSRLFDLNRANTLLRLLLEGPNVVDVDVDSRRLLDQQLKITCEDYIKYTTEQLCGEIPVLLNKAKEIRSAGEFSSPKIAQPVDFMGKPDQLRDIVTASFRLLSACDSKSYRLPENSLVAVQRKLLLYLTNANTVAIIMQPIEAGVVNQWRQFHALLMEGYSDEDRMIIGCPTDSQVRLLFHK